jgi:hypothetical protein
VSDAPHTRRRSKLKRKRSRKRGLSHHPPRDVAEMRIKMWKKRRRRKVCARGKGCSRASTRTCSSVVIAVFVVTSLAVKSSCKFGIGHNMQQCVSLSRSRVICVRIHFVEGAGKSI